MSPAVAAAARLSVVRNTLIRAASPLVGAKLGKALMG